ncbi:glycosyltransferase family 4 protein [Patescibacteria group bacterium]|nr:glycosyltransferase family 4 protein [Patescibacteria group bacterium]MBU2259379.1 glycosyltransferase family 4 protein [Patescibacteria group bacterium]
MKLLMISGDRSILQRKQGAFWYTLQELRKHFDRIDVICPRIPKASRNGDAMTHGGESALVGGSVYFHPCPWSLCFQSRWIIRKGRELVSTFGHDVATVHEYPPFYNGMGAARLAAKIRIPYALEIHHIVGMPRASSLMEWIGWLLSRLYLSRDARSANAVRVVNEKVGRQLMKWGVPEKKISVVPSFYLDKKLLTSIERPPIIYDVAFCGRIVTNKGLRKLIEVVHSLHGVRLVIIGDGPLRTKCEDLVRSLGMQNRVAFLGWMPDLEAVLGAVASASIFVMCSRSEGGPRSVLEAMAIGMPVVATPVGVVPEIIKDGVNGVITTGEPEDLAKKIRMLLSDSAMRERMAKEAPKILDTFERGKLIKEYADFLKSLATEKKKG